MIKALKYTSLSIFILMLLVMVNFFTIKKLDQNVLETKNLSPLYEPSGSAMLVPSAFIDGERFYIKIPAVDGNTLLGFCDTGGGLSMLIPTEENKERFASFIKTGLLKGIMPFKYIMFSDVVKDTLFPAPYPMRSFVLRNPFAEIAKPYLVLPPMDEELKLMMESIPEMDVFLGQGFFMHRSWTIDYIHQEIWLNTPLNTSQSNDSNVLKLGFKKNAVHENIYGHPSMSVEVDGEAIDVLFDTGASFVLSETGKKEMGKDQKTIGGSFIAASIFNKWKKEHPDWKIYPKSDMDHDIIEVPVVRIGGLEVGPVLFAIRPDENWSEGMIKSMDKVVKGAIGGSALKYLKVTIDYHSELIKFEQAQTAI